MTPTATPFTPHFGWLNRPAEVARIKAGMPHPEFAAAAPLLKDTGIGQDICFWDAEQSVLGKILLSMDQGAIGSCVSHGWARAVQDLLLIQIMQGGMEQWLGEVAREPIYGGSRVEIGGERGSMQDGSVGAWAADWVVKYGIVLYGTGDGMLPGYYDVQRCKQWGAQGVPSAFEISARLHPVKTTSAITTPEQMRDALVNGYPVAICGQTSRTMKRQPGGWCPKIGNDWGHCECERAHIVVKGGSSSPWGGDGAHPWAGDVPAFGEQNSWNGYLGTDNNQVQLASGRTITLPDGVYLSTYVDRAADLQQGDTFALSHLIGWATQKLTWII